MEFVVTLYEGGVAPKPESKKSEVKELRPEPKYKQLGIKLSKYGRFPDCVFCELVDNGKKALDRPDFKHQTTCEKRTLTPKPFDVIEEFDSYGRPTGKEIRTERRGQFKGECAPTSILIHARLIRMIEDQVTDDNGDPVYEDGKAKKEKRFTCSYSKKMVPTHDWVWNGEKWVPFFQWKPDRFNEPKEPEPEPTESERKWLAAYMRS